MRYLYQVVVVLGLLWVCVHPGYSARSFNKTSLALPVLGYASVVWADYNNDTFLDFALQGAPNGASNVDPVGRLYRNIGQGSTRNFTTDSNIATFQLSQRGGAFAWGD